MKDGHTFEQKRLIQGDRHALTAFSYLRWMNPQYIDKPEREQEEDSNNEPIPEMSLAAALQERRHSFSQGLISMIH
jgi:hypothetical protein